MASVFGMLFNVDQLALDRRLLRGGAAESAASGRRRRWRTRASPFVCSLMARPSGAAGSTWGGWGERKAAVLEAVGQGHDAGWVGGAVRAEGEQCPLLWSAQSSSAFGHFCWIQRVGTLNIYTFPRAVVRVKVGPIVSVTFL